MTDQEFKYLAIKNWEKYQVIQHGKSAPWCRLYASILDEHVGWTYTKKGVFSDLLALRTRLGHNLPNNFRTISRMLETDFRQARDVTLTVVWLISEGQLVLTNQQNGYENSGATPDQRRGEESREEKSTTPLPPSEKGEVDWDKIIQEPKTKPRKKSNGNGNGHFKLEEWVPEAEWQAYVEFRKTIRKPLTPHAMVLAQSKLWVLKQAGNDPIQVLNQSILNTWLGLFPVGSRPNGRGEEDWRLPE